MDNGTERIEEKGIMPFSNVPELAGSGEFESPVFRTPLGNMLLFALGVKPSEIDQYFNPEDKGIILDDNGKEIVTSAFEAAKSGRFTLSAQVRNTPTPESLSLENVRVKVWLPGEKLKSENRIMRSDDEDEDNIVANISEIVTDKDTSFSRFPFYTGKQLRELSLAIVSTSGGGDVQA